MAGPILNPVHSSILSPVHTGVLQGGGVAASGTMLNQSQNMGALTLAGDGAIAPILNFTPTNPAYTIESGDASNHFQIDSATGAITPTAAGNTAGLSGSPYTLETQLVCDEGTFTADVTVTASGNDANGNDLANSYSVASDADFTSLMAVSVATLSGKTALLRPGTYTWTDANLNNKLFTSEFTITPHDAALGVAFAIGDKELRAPTNLTLDSLLFTADFTLGVSDGNSGALVVKNDIDGFTVRNCELDGKLTESIATYGQPFTADEYGWRGMLGLDGTTNLIGPMTVINNAVHDCWRGLNLPGGAGLLTLKGNEFYNISVDGFVLAGERPNGGDILFNQIHSPISVNPPEVEVLSVDTANDRMTVDSDRFGSVSDGVTINIGASTTTPPAGTNYPGIGGANDYACTVFSVSAGETVLQFPVDITDAGSNVFVRVEPSHADMAQGVPGPGEIVLELKVIGNEYLAEEGLDGEWSQGLFFEDIAGLSIDGWYDSCAFVGNRGFNGNSKGLYVYNGRYTIVADNTMVCPSSIDVSNRPDVQMLQQFSTVGLGNLIYNNASADNGSVFAGDLVSGNHDVQPADYASSGLFVGTGGYNPTTIAQLRAAFERTDLDGEIDYDAQTYDLPSVNACTFPDFTDVTDAATSTVITVGAPVQITGIEDSEGNASSYGALASVTGDGSPELRLTSDVGGTTVVTDWTSEPFVIGPSGGYLWVRTTSDAANTTAADTVIRVGDQLNSWSVTTIAGTLFDDDFSTDTSGDYSSSGGSGTITYDGANDQLDFVQGSSFDGIISPEITVVDGVDYTVTWNATHTDADLQMDITVGSNSSAENLGSLPGAERIETGETADMSMTVTASGTSLYTKVRMRGGGAHTFSANRLTVEAA